MDITFESVRDIIVNTLSCEAEQVTPETNLFEDLEADSLEAVELSLALEEAFGTGTAAVISPIGELKVDDEKIHINHGQIGAVAQRLYDTLTGIQNGRVPDPFGWVVPIA